MATKFITSCASEWRPEEFVDELPPHLLDRIKEDVEFPPKTPNDVIFLCNSTEQQRLVWFNGAWILHRYLFIENTGV